MKQSLVNPQRKVVKDRGVTEKEVRKEMKGDRKNEIVVDMLYPNAELTYKLT